MFRKNPLIYVITVAVMITALAQPALARRSTVVLIPARYRVVSLLQDVARLRMVTVVSYQQQSGTSDSITHAWDGRSWNETTVADLAAKGKSEFVVVGDGASMDTAVQALTGAGVKAKSIPTLDIAKLVIKFAKLLDFNGQEIQWLGQRHGLKVTDINADRRRYGRYGKPGASARDAESDALMPEDTLDAAPMPPDETSADPSIIPEEPELEPVMDELLMEKGMMGKGIPEKAM